ncbi:MAG TPA: NAD(P)/FAD-dependent oxidoreductase [Fimbriimonadaceae bacterium]|nr:NAD(P)/FAD-dependent oxidoreductase [Fimbriimonadaceae bacterium]
MKVGVVGLGMAGLRAAMLLEKYGAEVELFEARGRPGGRLHTIDEGEGAVYEAGGEWIDADHLRCIRLLEEFSLEPMTRGSWPGKVVFDGEHSTEADLWSDALEDDLRVEAAARELCRNLVRPPWRNEEAANLDDQNLDAFVRDLTTTDRGLWWVTAKYRSDEGDDLDRVGLLGWLTGYLNYLDRDGDVMSAYRVPGGWRHLCERMLCRLRASAQFGAVLRRVRQDSDGVTLTFEDGHTRVDRVVLTLPPPALEQVVFEPALTCPKRCAIEACKMGHSVKICWEFEEAWWQDQGWGGSMMCDSPIQQTWNASMGEAPILSAYICGRDAEKWAALGDPVRAGIYELSLILPEAAKLFKRGWYHDWVTDPYCRGSYSHLAPGYVLEHMEHIAEPIGRVHFAGEHTAEWTGFVEGALESAERVVPEVLRA